jgi:enoyl-CoA hydratase
MPSTTHSPETIEISVHGDSVAWITLNRPAKANTRTVQMRAELATAYETLASDPTVKVLVITGKGERFFCAGMDLTEVTNRTSDERRGDLNSVPDLDLLARFPKPTIACINGYALGGGLEVALACDIRVVASGAKLGLPEVGHGFFPGGGASLFLPREIGFGNALAMMYSAEPIDSAEAVRLGLAIAEYPAGSLRTEVQRMADSFARHRVEALQAVKASVIDAREFPHSVARERDIARLMGLL